MALNILIVDDENDIRELVSGILDDEGYETRAVGSCIEAIDAMQKRSPNLVILDVWLGDGEIDGLRLLDLINENQEYVPVVMISGHGTIETAVSAIKKGAYDFIEKPFDSSRLITSVEKAIETAKLKKENAELKIKAKVSDDILGQSQSILILKQTIEKIAPLNGRCIILGPAGSDKEAIAREIHRLSPRAKNPFEAISCQSYTTSQLEIELFGIFINNFGEIKIKHGILERTNGGTLFINDLSTASSEIQMKVLKTLKEKTFFRIGSNEKIPLTARIIAGFPPNINELIKEGLFSDELFCRLNANMLKILPLASRREDVILLLNHYMEQSAKAHNARVRKFSTEAIGVLSSYSWPGDVMQLKNFVDWTLTINLSSKAMDGSIITIEDLPKEIVEGANSSEGSGINFISMFSELSIKDAREEFERQYFLEQLKRFSGNVSQTAKFVCMERSALHRKLKSLNITNIPKLDGNE